MNTLLIPFLYMAFSQPGNDTLSQMECNDSIYWDLKSITPISLSKTEREYVSFFEKNCNVDKTSKYRDTVGLSKYTESTASNLDRFIFRATYQSFNNVTGFSGSVFRYNKDPAYSGSLGTLGEFSVQRIIRQDSSNLTNSDRSYSEDLFFGFGGAYGLLLDFSDFLSLFMDLRVPLGIGMGGGFFVGFGSNQEFFLKFGSRKKLLLGIGFSETIRTVASSPVVFCMNFSIGFENFEKL